MRRSRTRRSRKFRPSGDSETRRPEGFSFLNDFFWISREWSQKALEEEQKKKEEERRKKEEEKKLQQAKLQKLTQANSEGAAEGNDTVAQNVAVTPPVLKKALKKNFASLDCGAKVVSANEEATGASNIISPSRCVDETKMCSFQTNCDFLFLLQG